MSVLSILLSTVFFILSGIHVYWGLGGKWAFDDAYPTKEDGTSLAKVPGVVASFIVATGLLGFGLFHLINGQIISVLLPSYLSAYGYWVIGFIFFLRAVGDFKSVGMFKKIKKTSFAKKDTKIYTPLCIFISCLTFLLIYLG
jgi:hypothetical protein